MFNNSAATAVETTVLIVMVLVATPTLIRNFGVSAYGAFVFLNLFSIYGALYFFDLGMEASLTTHIARYEAAELTEKMQGALLVALLYYGLLGLLVGLAVFLTGDAIAAKFIDTSNELNRHAIRQALSIISLNVLLQFLTLPFVAVLQGVRRYVVTKSVNSVGTVLQYTTIMIVSAYYHTIDTAFAILTVVTFLRLAFYALYFRFWLPQFRGFNSRLDFSVLKTLVGYSSILFVCRIIGLINKNIAKVLIWLFLPVVNLSIYDVVLRPSNTLRMPEGVVGTSIIPEVARLKQLGRIKEIGDLYLRLVRYTYLIQVPMAVSLGLFIRDILGHWVGPQFQQHYPLVLILVAAFVLAPVPSLAFSVIVGLEKIRNAIWISIVATILNAGLAIVLLQFMGLAGLLTATLVAQAFMFGPYLYKLRQYVGLQTRQLAMIFLRIAMVAVPAFLVQWTVRTWFRPQPALMFGVATAVGIVHLLVEYRFLLNAEERLFLRQTVGLRRRRPAPVTQPADPEYEPRE
jgi:O-antigen/teichoic acid export membrane protein